MKDKFTVAGLNPNGVSFAFTIGGTIRGKQPRWLCIGRCTSIISARYLLACTSTTKTTIPSTTTHRIWRQSRQANTQVFTCARPNDVHSPREQLVSINHKRKHGTLRPKVEHGIRNTPKRYGAIRRNSNESARSVEGRSSLSTQIRSFALGTACIVIGLADTASLTTPTSVENTVKASKLGLDPGNPA